MKFVLFMLIAGLTACHRPAPPVPVASVAKVQDQLTRLDRSVEEAGIRTDALDRSLDSARDRAAELMKELDRIENEILVAPTYQRSNLGQ